MSVLAIAMAAIGIYHLRYASVSDHKALTAVTEMPAVKSRIALIPLDGRPPCSQLVIDSGRTAGISVVTPSSKLMDYYSQPGDTKALQEWLTANIAGSDAAIISIDQLLYGGLLASRDGKLKKDDISRLVHYLRQLHKANPTVPLYAFSVLPRMNPADSIDTRRDRRLLMEYSRLVDKLALIQEGSLAEEASEAEITDKLASIRSQLDPATLNKYTDLFENNELLHEELAKLAEDGIITQLVIGQDDGERYSLPNLKLRQLRNFLGAHAIREDRVFITRGADEVALAILARHIITKNDFKPAFYIEYNSPETATAIAPYMAVSASESAADKLRYLGLIPAGEKEYADATLFISYGQESSLGLRRECAERIKSYLAKGEAVSLVDTSRHFSASETIFPQLINIGAPINGLTAYAGWNTVSNSVGTALAQSVIYLYAQSNAINTDELNSIEKSHVHNLSNRFLEDFYYLKDVIDIINNALHRKGYKNVNDLDLEHNYQWIVQDLQTAMNDRVYRLKLSLAYRQPYFKNVLSSQQWINAGGKMQKSGSLSTPLSYQVRDLSTDVSFPWPRTFEIIVNSTPLLYQVK